MGYLDHGCLLYSSCMYYTKSSVFRRYADNA
jgi:hypothetical protein